MNFKEVFVLAVRDIGEAKPKKKKFRKTRLLWILVVVCTFLLAVFQIVANCKKIDDMNDKIDTMKQDITAMDEQSSDIESILNGENQDEYFEKIAREEYGYCKPGEKVFYDSSYGE